VFDHAFSWPLRDTNKCTSDDLTHVLGEQDKPVLAGHGAATEVDVQPSLSLALLTILLLDHPILSRIDERIQQAHRMLHGAIMLPARRTEDPGTSPLMKSTTVLQQLPSGSWARGHCPGPLNSAELVLLENLQMGADVAN